MAEQFVNNTFAGQTASAGLLVGTTFTGTNALNTLGVTSLTINGTITNPNDTVAVTLNAATLPVQTTGQYVGFIQDTPAATPAYVFNVVIQGSPVAVAVSSANLSTLNLLSPVQLAAAPDDPNLPVCYCTGTRILTDRGEVAVERLREGDLVVTSTGEHRPIRWIGTRTMECHRHAEPAAVLPVRIAAHAFGENRPARDLRVSPGHAVAVDVLGEVLIPALALINGTTITQEQVRSVTYWHVELDSHDVLVAEGLGAESYLDMGNRVFFGGSVVALNPRPDADASARTHADFCRPFHMSGPVVEVVRARLDERAQVLTAQVARAA